MFRLLLGTADDLARGPARRAAGDLLERLGSRLQEQGVFLDMRDSG